MRQTLLEWIKVKLKGPCLCTSKVVDRRHHEWGCGREFYGYALEVTVRAHTGKCPLADEVLEVRGVKL